MRKNIFYSLIFLFVFYQPEANVFAKHGNSSPESFIMGIKDAFHISGIGEMAMGTIESGILISGMKLELKGKDNAVFLVTVGMIDKGGKTVATAVKGDEVTVQVRGVSEGDIQRGMVLADPGIFEMFSYIEATITIDNIAGNVPLKNDQSVQVLIRGAAIFGHTVLTGTEIQPGTSGTIGIKLENSAPFLVNDKFDFRYGVKSIASGVIKKLTK